MIKSPYTLIRCTNIENNVYVVDISTPSNAQIITYKEPIMNTLHIFLYTVILLFTLNGCELYETI